MSSSEVARITLQIESRKRQIHVAAVTSASQELQRQHRKMLSELNDLYSKCDELGRTYDLLASDSTRAISDGNLPWLPDLESLQSRVQGVAAGFTALRQRHEQAVNFLNSVLATVRQPPGGMELDEEVVRLTAMRVEALRASHREIKRRIMEEEWDDLPFYGGDSVREREECLHCGNELEDAQRAYCSEHCKEVHQAVFGLSEEEEDYG